MLKFWTGLVTDSPLGSIWVAVSERGLVAIGYGIDVGDQLQRLERRGFSDYQYSVEKTSLPLLQIGEYLHGKRKAFSIPIDWSGLTAFHRQVLEATCNIAYGETITYKELAMQSGKPRAARAVGRAEALNPMPLVVPCHRVIGSDGRLHGYNGPQGVKTKAWLLALEKRVLSGVNPQG